MVLRMTVNDAVVVEAESLEVVRRQAKQLREAEKVMNDLGISPILAPNIGQPCHSKERGIIGRCMSLKECYPYFKLPELPVSDTWVMGLYDTCSYMGPTGRSVFGVCCNQNNNTRTPVLELEDEEVTDDSEIDDNDLDAIIEEFPLEAQLSTPGAANCGARTVRPVPILYNQETVITEGINPANGEQGSLYNLYGLYPGMIGPVGTELRPVESPWARRFLYNRPSTRIVNGNVAIQHEYPFMAVLLNRNRQFCGGSLIDSKHILTAAHCVAHMSKYDVQNLRVRLGDHNIKTSSDANHVEKRVKRVIRHKGFSSSTLWNDVAILTLDEEVSSNQNIQPICLAHGTSNYVGNVVTVAGWGTLKEKGKQPDVLMKVDVKVWENTRCKKSYGSKAPGGITSHMLCASDHQKDSCSGDSGGPLFDCPWQGPCTQIGIVSWGIGCAQPQFPGVYTRVTEMLPWIERIVAEY